MVKVKWLATGDAHGEFSRFYAVQKRAEEGWPQLIM